MESLSVARYNSGMPKSLLEIDLAALCKDIETVSGMTAREVARRIDVNEKVYHSWKAGRREPNGQYTARLFILRSQVEHACSTKIPLRYKDQVLSADDTLE